eukprot:188868_1
MAILTILWFILVLIGNAEDELYTSDCPCNNISFCDNVKINHEKELYGFVRGNGDAFNISMVNAINWTYVTTIAFEPTLSPTPSPELMCEAHSRSVRVIMGALNLNLPLTNNATKRLIWIQQQFQLVRSYYYDGLLFDYELPMNQQQCKQYTELVNQTTQYFHHNMYGSQICVAVPWNAFLVDGRQYDYYGLSLVSDFLYIMDYATQSIIFDRQCIASANTPFQGTQFALQSYLNLNIAPNKLILGLPWYGFVYLCLLNEMESKTSKYCPLSFDTFMGYNCSDGIGQTKSYAFIMDIIDQKYNITQIQMDRNTRSPYFNYQNNINAYVYQVWFDNANSLRSKYMLAKSYELKGIGPFHLNDIIYTNSEKEKERGIEMWTALDSFFLTDEV